MSLNRYQKRIAHGIQAGHAQRTWEKMVEKPPFLTRIFGSTSTKRWNEQMNAMRRSIQLELNLYGKYMLRGDWDRFDGAQKEFFATLFTRMHGNFQPKTEAEITWNRKILQIIRGVVGKPGEGK